LGLVGSSIEFPVQVLVENPLTWYQALLARGGTLIAVGGVLLAAAAFGLVMLLSGRLKPGDLAARRLFRRRPAAAPATDPLNDSPLAADSTASVQAAPKIQGAIAYLQRLNMQEAADGPNIIPIMADELTIGSEGSNDLLINDESVNPRHARLVQTTDTEFLVTDLGTEAGTWVNYAPVSSDGSHLRDGDLLHIGRVAFRFLIAT
jgi:hypothetical protein